MDTQIKTVKEVTDYLNKAGVKMENEGFCLEVKNYDSGIEISLLLTCGPNATDVRFRSTMIGLIIKKVASSNNYSFIQDGVCLIIRRLEGFNTLKLQEISREIKKIKTTYQDVLKMTKSLSEQLYNQETSEKSKLETKIKQIVNKL